jgi:hypothetical protein
MRASPPAVKELMNMSNATNEIPARERFALRSVEARIAWWVEQARRPTVEALRLAS